MSRVRKTAGSARPDEALQRMAVDRIAKFKAPASLLAITNAAGGIQYGSYGDAGDGTEPSLDTQFRIASCTKSFTAVRILQLRDAGLLDLDAPITQLLPNPLRLLLPREDSIIPTPRMLLTMSAGFATDNEWADRQESISQADLDELLAQGVRFIAEPGTQYEYSNLGYAILGRIAEELCGQPFTAQVGEQVLEPLGLGSIGFAHDSQRETAVGYSYQAKSWVGQPFTEPGAFSPIGGLFASAKELLSWGQWLAEAFIPGASDAVLSASSRREMQTAWIRRPTQEAVISYGFGVFVEQEPELGIVVSHSGGYPGFSSHMRWRIDSGTVAVGFENGTYAGVYAPVKAMLRAVEASAAVAFAEPQKLESQNVAQKTSAAEPWPETRHAVEAVTRLVEQWNDALADQIFTANVADDLPYALRRAQAAELLLDQGESLIAEDVDYPTAAAATWRLRGSGGSIRVAITLHPLDPPRVQWMELTPES